MVRLMDKVKGILESAVQNDDKIRQNILQEFFSNISCQVEDEVLCMKYLYNLPTQHHNFFAFLSCT